MSEAENGKVACDRIESEQFDLILTDVKMPVMDGFTLMKNLGDLTDEIPSAIDIALPTGAHRPRLTALVAWHMFDPDTFHIGRGTLAVDSETSIGIYSAERSIIDAFRLRHREGDLAGWCASFRGCAHAQVG